MGRLVNNKGMVRMSKDGVSHDFVLESVPVWEALGWSPEEPNEKSEPNAVAELLAEAAAAEAEEREDGNDAKLREALSNEPKAVTGPKTQKK